MFRAAKSPWRTFRETKCCIPRPIWNDQQSKSVDVTERCEFVGIESFGNVAIFSPAKYSILIASRKRLF